MSGKYFSIAILLICLSITANAATITVVNTSNSGAGSLRQAITDAVDGDAIDFNLPGCPCTILLSSSLSIGGKDITITGPGISQLTIDGQDASRIFVITGPGFSNVTISNLTMTNGFVSGGGNFGGAIYLDSRVLTLVDVAITSSSASRGGAIAVSDIAGLNLIRTTLSDNHALIAGGAITTPTSGPASPMIKIANSTITGNSAVSIGGAIDMVNGTLDMINTTVSNNTNTSPATGTGGGALANEGSAVTIRGGSFTQNDAATGGAILTTAGTTELSRTSIANNSADLTGGGIQADGGSVTINETTVSTNQANGPNGPTGGGGGLYNSGGTVVIRNSTVTGNIATAIGGGLYNGSSLSVINSTISGNTVNGNAGGGVLGGTGSTTDLLNCTITLNSAGNLGGGIATTAVSATVNLGSSIVAQNVTNSNNSIDINSAIATRGYNLVGSNQGNDVVSDSVNFDLVGTAAVPINAQLLPLANNGGPTQTHALIATSPAVDRAQTMAGVTTDQRGSPRFMDTPGAANRPGSDLSDIGAYELVNPTAATFSISGKVLDLNGLVVRNATVVVIDSDGNAWRSVTGSFGTYRIEELRANRTYVIWVTGTRYQYQPQLVTVNIDTELDLTGGQLTQTRKK